MGHTSAGICRFGHAWIVVALGLAMGLAITGCSTAGSGSEAQTSGATTSKTQATASSAPAQAASDVQVCAECNKKGMPPVVEGQAADESGVQVLKVSFVNGYYSPNSFTVKAGAPVRVVFSGKAKGCLAKPTFKALGLTGDVTSTGSATIDLGALKAGTYTWTCAMGMNKGAITVQ